MQKHPFYWLFFNLYIYIYYIYKCNQSTLNYKKLKQQLKKQQKDKRIRVIFSRSDLGLGIVEHLLHEKTLGLVLGQARSSKKEMGSHIFQI